MMKVIVIEDEKMVLSGTLSLLQNLELEVIGTASTVEKAYSLLLDKQPDLVLLDIELGNQSAFDLLSRFEEIPFQVIFTTAHQQYAFDAFQFSAVDFLLKPLSNKGLKEAIEKAQDSISKDQALSLQTLQHNLQSDSKDQKLILKTQDKIHVLKLEDIVRCESDLSYTLFYTEEDKIIVSKTLGYYEELLTKFDFYRVHKSHLINLQHVVQIHKSDGGEVELSDGSRASISQRRKEDFLQKVDNLGLR